MNKKLNEFLSNIEIDYDSFNNKALQFLVAQGWIKTQATGHNWLLWSGW